MRRGLSGPSSNDDYLGHFKKTMITYLLTYLCANFSLLGLSVFELGPMYATYKQTDDRRQTKASLSAPAY